ncbi:hypothetical protein CAPTEDRAFT_100694 [Capitella teleta]|uniref:Uncharacterized protein n=1 Tax=Capitella teleta TaxID=283909 RepID=R7THA6_CAPTE|nr:hypothetical protein CAPTEDRAFT_100694 [Capitella teleta]|eukprot:ELT90505.1 hypothetical protein CAPTEDRAFT_100694 [Capitella teleta]
MKQRVIFSSSNCCQILDDITPESEVFDRQKAWIYPSKSPLFCVTTYLHVIFLEASAAVKVEELVFNNHWLKDLATLSPHFQTYDLEAFHSLLNHSQAMNGR